MIVYFLFFKQIKSTQKDTEADPDGLSTFREPALPLPSGRLLGADRWPRSVCERDLRDLQASWARDSLVLILGNVKDKNVLEFLGSTNVQCELFSFLAHRDSFVVWPILPLIMNTGF